MDKPIKDDKENIRSPLICHDALNPNWAKVFGLFKNENTTNHFIKNINILIPMFVVKLFCSRH